ncbi:MAG: polyprenyl diphosphate synthase [Clostridia bacterium]
MLTHLSVIMDGNGRWACNRGLPRTAGHKEGVKNIERLIKLCVKEDIKVLSLFVFSTENILRPQEEVKGLFRLAKDYFNKVSEFNKKNISVKVSGSRTNLPLDLIAAIDKVQSGTVNNTGLILNLCFNYGGRDEILHAVNKIITENKTDIDSLTFEKYLYHQLPPPDMIIRTGGQIRLSNFLLYQSAYSELYFTDVLWPDFNEKDFYQAIDEYNSRKRNFGKI